MRDVYKRQPYESIKDELFLKELVDSLAMSGIANEIDVYKRQDLIHTVNYMLVNILWE